MAKEHSGTKKNKTSSRTKILNTLLVVFAAVFVFSGVMLVKNIVQGKKEQAAFDDLATPMHNIEMDESLVDKTRLLLLQYERLKEKNSDFAGWIRIDGTKLDYPVMHTPDNMEYYLRRTFDKKYSISGTPFMDKNCTADSRLVLIYGHHMDNGTMFAPLHNYRKKEFWDSHREIRFDTLTETRTYEVISAFYTEIDATGTKGLFDYYNYSGDLTDQQFDTYIANVKALSVHTSDTEVTKEDRLLTLSTCSWHSETGRFVVVAKLKESKTSDFE